MFVLKSKYDALARAYAHEAKASEANANLASQLMEANFELARERDAANAKIDRIVAPLHAANAKRKADAKGATL